MRPFLSFLMLLLVFTSCKKEGASATPETTVLNIPSLSLTDPGSIDSLVQRIGNARIVMLGEASHGTSEFYQWRTLISQRLIREKGFRGIAVEGEWADSYRVNEFVRGPRRDSAQAVALLRQYDRWPTWMWGNIEVAQLVNWLNLYNQGRPAAQQAGFYGLDVYCLWESNRELLARLSNDSLLRLARGVEQCFAPFSADPIAYANAVAAAGANCQTQAEALYQGVLQHTGNTTAVDEAAFVLHQNALVVYNGEQYYSAAASSNTRSWNIRDMHMQLTVRRLLQHWGPDSKIIIWAHNTHVGDARYTDMAAAGEFNVGQLLRQEYGNGQVYIVGSGTYSGTVIAADEWGSPIGVKSVPEAQAGSWESILHASGTGDRILFSDMLVGIPRLLEPVGHRAIGVVYDPRRESGNYVPSVIPKRYDAFLFIDVTHALQPLGTPVRNEPPDTYPSGY
jgi:erythromycin esterase